MLDRLLGRRTGDDRHHTQPAQPPQPDASERTECPHVAMTPRWDNIDDMGHEDRASAFVCDSCQQALTPAEARLARETAGERLRRD